VVLFEPGTPNRGFSEPGLPRRWPLEPSVVRESQPGGRDVPIAPPFVDARLVRAHRFAERGRHASAGRWYHAALEGARRRGDDRAAAAACREVLRWLCAREEWDAAHHRAQETLAGLRDPPSRLLVSALAAEILVARAECGAAEAVLSNAFAEATAASVPVPVAVQAVEAELRFWQGRLDDARDALSGWPRYPPALMTIGLVAWLRRDDDTLARTVEILSQESSPTSVLRHATVALLHAALVDEPARVGDRTVAVERLAPSCGCPRLARLARLLATEARVFAGCDGPHQARSPGARAPLLDMLLHEWHDACRARDRPREARAAAALVRAGVGVVRVWRWGSRDMHLIHSIPILLQLVQDAEDDQSALVAACGWIRRETGADAVAFLGNDRTVIAVDGWTAADTADFAAEPVSEHDATATSLPAGDLVIRARVRYAGTATGFVVIRGREAHRRVMSDAAETAAALCGPALRARVDIVSSLRRAPSLAGEILGRSPAIAALREAIARTAATPFPVLVEGESGTGKELVARAIHRLSPRRDRRFSAVNAAALTDELVEAELFGHSRGAFTGAVAPRAGLFEDAHGGSLFLDEVSELSPRAQAKLLRVLQEREIRRVGENTARAVDVRIIAATNRSLSEAVRGGAFRDDLLFRLAVVTLRLPPLRERIEDVPILAQASWRQLAADTGKRAVLGPDAVARLCRHRWPGNVRELQNAMAALIVSAPDRGRVSARHVNAVLADADECAATPPLSLDQTRLSCERSAVLRALVRNGGRRVLAARELGLTRQGLTKAMKRLGLDDGKRDAGVA
jgi:DNA-binding NtrC family response regulator